MVKYTSKKKKCGLHVVRPSLTFSRSLGPLVLVHPVRSLLGVAWILPGFARRCQARPSYNLLPLPFPLLIVDVVKPLHTLRQKILQKLLTTPRGSIRQLRIIVISELIKHIIHFSLSIPHRIPRIAPIS